MKNVNFEKIGFYIALYATVLPLLWIGMFKFTPYEANAIQPLIAGSFLFSWLYKVMSIQAVSSFMGTFEIITGLLLAAYPFNKKLSLVGSALTAFIFLGTISFLITNAGIFKIVDGFFITDFFILKDLAFLGVAIMTFGKSLTYTRQNK